jgi:hypothetical protein
MLMPNERAVGEASITCSSAPHIPPCVRIWPPFLLLCLGTTLTAVTQNDGMKLKYSYAQRNKHINTNNPKNVSPAAVTKTEGQKEKTSR